MTTLKEVLTMDFQGKNIVIIGIPASGKSFLADTLHGSLPDHALIHTDDYIEHGFEQSLYALIEDLKSKPEYDRNVIIEGITAYRLLRKGVELNSFYPDVVIELIIDEDQMERIYTESRDPEKLKGAKSTAKACQTILAKYKAMEMPFEKAPLWFQVLNQH